MKEKDMKEEEIEALVKKYYKLAYYIANKCIAQGNVDREEAYSDAMLGLMKALRSKSFDPNQATIKTYLSTCVINEIRMRLRKPNARYREVSLGTPIAVDAKGNELLLQDLLIDNSFEEYLERYCFVEQARQIMRNTKLNSIQTKILRLHLKGFTQREIGEQLDLPQPRVHKQLRKARQKLCASATTINEEGEIKNENNI